MIPVAKVTRRRAPPDSAFLGDLRRFYYWDSYEAPLAHSDLAMHELYLALFGPSSALGQMAPDPARLDRSAVRAARHDDGGLRRNRAKPAYAAGDKIARFTLFAQSAARSSRAATTSISISVCPCRS